SDGHTGSSEDDYSRFMAGFAKFQHTMDITNAKNSMPANGVDLLEPRFKLARIWLEI
ncbi:hypothetical protein CEXT_329951, partial [Caerostris extrusa]